MPTVGTVPAPVTPPAAAPVAAEAGSSVPELDGEGVGAEGLEALVSADGGSGYIPGLDDEEAFGEDPKCGANAGRVLGKYLANAGQRRGKHLESPGQILCKCLANA